MHDVYKVQRCNKVYNESPCCAAEPYPSILFEIRRWPGKADPIVDTSIVVFFGYAVLANW
jgi:hypothetical protein